MACSGTALLVHTAYLTLFNQCGTADTVGYICLPKKNVFKPVDTQQEAFFVVPVAAFCELNPLEENVPSRLVQS
jgi:hypothetical protein